MTLSHRHRTVSTVKKSVKVSEINTARELSPGTSPTRIERNVRTYVQCRGGMTDDAGDDFVCAEGEHIASEGMRKGDPGLRPILYS